MFDNTLKRHSKHKILFAIPSFQDPYSPGHTEQLGPIIRILNEEKFNHVVLFGLQIWKLNAFLTEQYLQTHWPDVQVDRHILPITDIGIYKDIFYNLKEALGEYQSLFQTKDNEISFLLPPSLCDRLLDCWLLLATSLNVETQIFQMESHFSMAGIYSDDIWNKGLDWLTESPREFNDKALDKHPQLPVTLTFRQRQYLEQLPSQHASILLKNVSLDLAQCIAKFIAHQHVLSHCLTIHCNEIPPEIIDPILFGYSKNIHGGKTIFRKGLLHRFNKGVILLLEANTLQASTQSKIAQRINDPSNDQHYIFVSKQQTLSQPLEQMLYNVNLPAYA